MKNLMVKDIAFTTMMNEKRNIEESMKTDDIECIQCPHFVRHVRFLFLNLLGLI